MAQQYLKMTEHRFEVDRLQEELKAWPDVWNELPWRTRAYTNSPHREIDDIWVRYNPLRNFDGNWEKFNGPHEAEWYPVAWRIPSVIELVISLATKLEAKEVGAVLVTRVPPGKQVYPHVDGGWHARYYEKFVIQVASSPGQSFNFEGESLDARPGECYWFDNSQSHWVLNPTSEERISLIVCVRREKCH
jgi:mannose-6-phosphate isomerase-like protein (cupin superfamily)